jgi:energy-coupling factor transport system substrate-specific component
LIGLIMVAAVSASLAVLGIFPFFWALMYLGLSDVVPLVIGAVLLVRPGVRVLESISRGNLHRF